MADPAPNPPTPIQAALERLTFEAQYVRDVLFLADGGTCRMSSQSAQRLYDGLAWTINVLRASQPVGPVGGAPGQPPVPGG